MWAAFIGGNTKLVAPVARYFHYASERGYLLPAVIALGLGISTLSVLALRTVSQNSQTLSGQSYSTLAREAAQSGIAAAISCIRQSPGSPPSAWTNTNVLTPKKDCTLTTQPSQSETVSGSSSSDISTTYSVPLPTYEDPPTNSTLIVQSTGTAMLRTAVTSTPVVLATETVRATVSVSQSATNTTTNTTTSIHTADSVSTGLATTCTVADSWVYCWGSNANLQLGIGKNVKDDIAKSPMAVAQTAITAGRGPCSASGWTGCYEWNPSAWPAQPANPMIGKSVKKVSVGDDHTCAIATDTNGLNGRAYCWGRNGSGQLGDTTTNDSSIPVEVYTGEAKTRQCTHQSWSITGPYCDQWDMPRDVGASSLRNSDGSLKTVTDISTGNGFTCVLTSDGTVSCWGNNAYGQLGNTSRTDSAAPVSVSYDTTAIIRTCTHQSWSITGWYCDRWNTDAYGLKKDIAASGLAGKSVKQQNGLATLHGGGTMCVISTEDKAYCWGSNYSGQAGNGGAVASSTTGSGSYYNSNANHCTDGRAAAIASAKADAPIATSNDLLRPTEVQTTLKFDSIAINSSTTGDTNNGAEYTYTSAKTSDAPTNPNQSRLYYWGGTMSFTTTSTCSSNSDTYGGDSTRASATARRNYTGQTTPAGPLYNTGTAAINGKPLRLTAGNPVNGLFCTQLFTSELYCDSHSNGVNKGQLGNGHTCNSSCSAYSGPQAVTMNPSPAPPYLTLSGVGLSISAIDSSPNGHTCVVVSGRLGCWGLNGSGQLGDASTTNRSYPTAVDISPNSALYSNETTTTTTSTQAAINSVTVF